MTTVKFQITLFSSDKLKDVYNYQVDFVNLTEDSGTTGVPFTCNFETNEGIDWTIEFYLKGTYLYILGQRYVSYSDYLSIVLRRDTEAEVDIEWEISVLKQDNVKLKDSTYKKEALKKRESLRFTKFLERKELFNAGNGILEKDNLILTGQITIYKSDAERIKFSDVYLKVEDHLIPSCKFLLAQCSKFFEDKLSELEENKRFIVLDEITFEVAEQMSKFIIDGKIEESDLLKFTGPLLIAASKFKIEKLKIYCENYLTHKLTVENVVETMEFAIDGSSETLLDKCIIFIGRNCPKIPDTNWESHITKYPKNFSRLFQHCVLENFGHIPKKKKYFTGNSVKVPRNCQCKLSHDFSRLFEEGLFSDVIMKVEGRELKGHKMILASRSAYFKRIIDAKEAFHRKTQRTSQIVLVFEKYDFAAFQEMIRYIYSGRVDSMKEFALKLLVGASKFKLKGLTDLCGKYLQTTLTNENFLKLLSAADKYECLELKEKCINYFANEINRELFKSSAWQKLVLNHPKLLSEIFKDWMKNHFVCMSNKN